MCERRAVVVFLEALFRVMFDLFPFPIKGDSMARFSFSHIVLSATAALGLQSLFIAEARAVSFRVVAGGGYESVQFEKEESDPETPKPFTGYALQALGEVGFLDTVPGFSLLAGGGLRYSKITAKDGDSESTLNPLMVAGEFGAEFSLIPLLRVQALVGYDSSISGEYELKGGGNSYSFDLDYFRRFQVSARALVTAAPFLSVGLEPVYFTGSSKVKDTDNLGLEESKFSGYAIKAVAAFTL